MEMPSGLGSFETYDALVYNIKDRIANGSKVETIGNSASKIASGQTVFYWISNEDTIVLGVELQVKSQGLVVSVTGKHPKWKGRAPFASDLYGTIVADNHKSLRLHSDSQLSDEGLLLWKRLLSSGKKVSVYDQQNPGKSFATFSTAAEMDQYFANDNTDYMRYQYVVSESGEPLAETRSFFNTRRYRELAGLNLED